MATKNLKIQYISDLHLEFKENREFLDQFKIKPVADYLCIAGDFGYLNPLRKHHFFDKVTDRFIKYLNDNWKHVIMVPGNHEFYGRQIMTKLPNVVDIDSNITLLNNGTKYFPENDVLFIGSTLWSHIPEDKRFIVMRSMNDYRYIKFEEGRTLNPDISTDLFFKNVEFIENELKVSTAKKNVVVTHHAPLLGFINKAYVHSQINDAYASDLSNLILDYKPSLWVSGHTHFKERLTMGQTIAVENSFGYSWNKGYDKLNLQLNVFTLI